MSPESGWFPSSMAAHLAGMGLTLERTEDGELFLDGLQHLSIEDRERALHIAQENRLLILAELERHGGMLSNPYVLHYRLHCPNYWHGCLSCPDANHRKLDFCRRYPMPEMEG